MTPLLAWKLNVADPRVASVRYRALMPARGLSGLGYESLVLSGGENVRDWSRISALILVKSFRAQDVALAAAARAAGKPVFFDLCDNIFVEDYGGAEGEQRRRLQEILPHCSAVVTTGPEMARILKAHCPPQTAIHIIPDQEERIETTRALLCHHEWRGNHQRLRIGHETVRRRGDVRWSFLRKRAAPKAQRDGKTIVWFGNSGAAHGRFGLAALADIAPDLIALAAKMALRLRVVTDDQEKAERFARETDIPVEFRRWSALDVFSDIEGADVCVIPNSMDAFSAPKSANRAVLALSLGVPVVATRAPAMEPLAGCVVFDDWQGGIALYLNSPARAAADVAKGRTVIAREYAEPRIAALWDALLKAAMAPA